MDYQEITLITLRKVSEHLKIVIDDDTWAEMYADLMDVFEKHL